MGLIRRVRSWLQPRVDDGDLGKAGSALALALLTVLATGVAALQGQASLEAQRSGRIAEQLALEATGRDTSAVIQVGAAYGTYRRWHEELQRSTWASYERIRNAGPESEALLEALQNAGNEIAAWVQGQSPLLQPPYYDPARALSDNFAYEADAITGPSTAAAERRANELAVAKVWDGKASAYVTILTVLAVGLFFVGLSANVGAGRRLLAWSGVGFGTAAGLWAIAVAAQPIHRVPDEAIDHLVAAQIALAQAPVLAGVGTRQDIDLTPYETSVSESDAAVRRDPAYVAAYQLRGAAQIVYANQLIIGQITGRDPTALLQAGIDDLRHYLEARPDDYSAWWNVGWAAYLLEDYPASIEATERALQLVPTQFILYLNRALARIGLGDRAAATADVDQALALAAADASDTANWYLGQSDLDIGRLAELRPPVADFLRETQLRLREAQVALRVLGSPVPDAGAPALDRVEVRPIEVGHYASGRITEAAPISSGDHVASTDAVGVRVRATGGLSGRNLSARIWINGLPRPEYVRDIVATESAVTLDLVSPYGLAGIDPEPGAYELELYVDGSRRFEFDWVVDPRPAQPVFTRSASDMVATLTADGFTCPAAEPLETGAETTCSWVTSLRSFWVLVGWDDADRVTRVVVTVRTTDPNESIADIAPLLFNYAAALLYPADLTDRVFAWIATQGEAVNDLEIGGATLRVYGANATDRSMDITAPWP